MQVKIDTKEKFHVLTPLEQDISANMTENLVAKLLQCLESDVKNVVLNLCNVDNLDEHAAKSILGTQQKFYEENHSFVVCCLNNSVETKLDKAELLELMNVTPTESEAWDIVQMEEIERELLSDE